MVPAGLAGPEQEDRVTYHPPAPYSTVPPPPPGTRVRGRISGRVGVVQKYRPGHPLGLFPVAWLDGSGLWETAKTSDIHVIGGVKRVPAA